MQAETHAFRVASDIMTPEPVCIDLGTTLRQTARIFEEHGISGAPVVDGGGRLVGVVSRSDLIRRCLEGGDDRDPVLLVELLGSDDDPDAGPLPERSILVEDCMSPEPITAGPTTPLKELAARMVEARVHRVIVIDRGRIPVGIVTSLDLVKALARTHP